MLIVHSLLVIALLLSGVRPAAAQDLAPRAYVITPLHSSAVNLTWSFYDGGLNFNGTVPITGATGTYSIPNITLYHSFGFFGRSANITVALPYGVGTFSGQVLGSNKSVYRSGLLDFVSRFSVNLIGGPAMQAQEFGKWKQKVILGAGVWLYTTNPAFYDIPKPEPQTESPIGSFEGHLSYTFKERAWVSLDGNFWWGGITALNSIRNLKTKQNVWSESPLRCRSIIRNPVLP